MRPLIAHTCEQLKLEMSADGHISHLLLSDEDK